MKRHLTRSGLGALVLTAVLSGTGALRAQEPDPAGLDALLAQLQKTDAKAWQARAVAMKAAAKEARAAAKLLAEQAAAKATAALVEAEKGKQLEAEIDKLARLRAALASMSFRDPAAQGEAKASERGRLELALAGLQKLSAAAWDARSAAMRTNAASHDKRAVELKRQGAGLVAEATAKEAAAKTLDDELGKLEKLRALVATLEPGLLVAKTAAPKMAPKQAAPKKVAPKKVAPKKVAPKKVAAKKEAAKKEAVPKPAPKKAAKPPAAAAPAMPGKQVDSAATPEQAAAGLVTYVDHVYPIFESNCFDCHDSDDPSSGLDLSSHATALQGGSSGRTIRPGDPDESRLFLLVSHKEKPTMPPDEPRIDKPLIETIRTWIAQGAPKDLAHAKKLAAERVAKQKAAQAAAPAAVRLEVQAVMPAELVAVKKAWPDRPGALRAIAAAPAAPLLAVPGFHQVLLLHQDDLRELGVLDFPFGQVEALSFSADGTALLAAGGIPGKQGGAVLYDVRTGSERGRFGERRDVVLAAAVSPRAELVAIGDTRRRLEVVRVRDALSLWEQKHEDWVTAVAFSADGELLASGDRQGFLQVREASNGREVHTMKATDGMLADLAFSPDSATLAAAGADRAVCSYRMRDGRRLFRQQVHADSVLCIAWRTRTRLVTGGADGRMLHWKSDGNRERELPKVGEWVYDLAVGADGGRLFAVDWQGRLTAVDVKSGKVLRQVTPLLVAQ